MSDRIDIGDISDAQLIELVSNQVTPKEKAIPFLKEMLSEFGRDKFSLRYGVRNPCNEAEKIDLKFWRQQISEEEFRTAIRSYATRPVDNEMLASLEKDIEANLKYYSGFLQAVIAAQNLCVRENDIRAGKSQESLADDYCSLLNGESDMFSDELISCSSYLEEINTEQGKGVIAEKEFTGTTAWWVAVQAFRYTTELWKSCRETSIKSQTTYNYTHAVSACSLFENFMEGMPKPQRLHSLLSEEILRARNYLKKVESECSVNDVQTSRLSDREYQQILDVMQNMALVMERSPSAFNAMNEETLRTHFLVQLNGQWPGQATGETFNYEGKTDILVRRNGANIFIAECKFWAGPKSHIETIDQLLGYSSWRDTKLAIVVFNRNRDFSKVLSTIDETTRNHPNCKCELGRLSETMTKYTFSHKDDPDRELVLSVMAFDIPASFHDDIKG